MGRTHRGHESPARPGPFQAPRALAAPEGGIQEPSLCVYACVCMFVCVCVRVFDAFAYVSACVCTVCGGPKELPRFLTSGRLRSPVKRSDASCNLGDR